MPGDSTNLNIKSRTQHTYDAIIVGSGISGGWAAKELCERGLKVLLLERDDYIKSKEKSVAPSTLQVFKNLKVILQVFQMEQIFSLCNVCLF